MATSTPETRDELPPSPGGVDRPDYVPAGHNLTSVTEKISGLVLTRPTGLGWLGFFGFSNILVVVLLGVGGLLAPFRHRHLGPASAERLGLRHHRLRVVDRNRPRRHAHLGLPAADAPEMAHLDQPHRRGHDHFRRDVRGPVPADAPGPAVVLLLAGAVSRTP